MLNNYSWEGFLNNTRLDDNLFIEIKRLSDFFKIKIIYETGTYLGGLTERLAKIGPKVKTVEYVKEFFDRSKERLSSLQNVEIYNDDSASFLDKDLIEGSEGILLFLDAHGFGGTLPLHEELKVIAKKKIKPPVIFIHDFKTNSRPRSGYDPGLTLEDLNSFFVDIYGRYAHYFIENIGTNFRGTGIFFPKE